MDSLLKALLMAGLVLALGACAPLPPGQVKKQDAPGQIMHKTGCNPASGKCKDK